MQSPFAPKLLGQLGTERSGLAEIGFKSQLEKATTKSQQSHTFLSTAIQQTAFNKQTGKREKKNQNSLIDDAEKRNGTVLRDKYRHSTWEVGAQSQLTITSMTIQKCN